VQVAAAVFSKGHRHDQEFIALITENNPQATSVALRQVRRMRDGGKRCDHCRGRLEPLSCSGHGSQATADLAATEPQGRADPQSPLPGRLAHRCQPVRDCPGHSDWVQHSAVAYGGRISRTAGEGATLLSRSDNDRLDTGRPHHQSLLAFLPARYRRRSVPRRRRRTARGSRAILQSISSRTGPG
jgi:hypothetical protein